MLLIGLTGSIATGKSTVSSLLSAPPYSLPIIDADVLARKVVEPGTRGYKAIVEHFGPTTPDLLLPPGEGEAQHLGRPLNRPALGRRVFGDSEERKKDRAVLNGIVHPAVRAEMFRAVLRHYLRGHWAVVLDIPLLFESGLDRFCGTVVVVGVRDPLVQKRRLMERDDHLTAEDAENRVRSQGDVRTKARRAEARNDAAAAATASKTKGVVLWNDGTRDELALQVGDAVRTLRTTHPTWWSWLLLACPPLAVAVSAWRYWQNVKINKRWEVAQGEAVKGKL